MIDDDVDENLFRYSSLSLYLMIMVMMMMVKTMIIIFSDLPHHLCPSSLVSCHWPLLPKMGWFVIINLVIVKLFFFPSDPQLALASWCCKNFSLSPSANANQTEVLSKFFVD